MSTLTQCSLWPRKKETAPPRENSGSSSRRSLRRWWWIGGAVCLVGGLTVLGFYRWHWHQYRRFQEVRPGVLYRVGLPSELGFRQIVQEYGIRTVVCLTEKPMPRFRHGWFFDVRLPSGPLESQLAQELGVRFVHWPIYRQGPWPWPDPAHLEAFFRLMDNPDNWPVLIHCWAGKHRTGTLVALYRLEYDRWPISAVLEEMYSLGFGPVYSLQECDLRTYVRRPRPSAEQWQALQEFFAPLLHEETADYDHLVWALQTHQQDPAVQARLEEYLQTGRPFALCLADRLIKGSEDPLLQVVLRSAERVVFSNSNSPANELIAAVGILADYGTPEVRTLLLETFREEMAHPEISDRYQALVAGLTNRYRTTRLPYLKLLLEDRRPRPDPEAAGVYYADTAVARLAAIVQVDFIGRRGMASREEWDQAIQWAKQWFAEHPDAGEIAQE